MLLVKFGSAGSLSWRKVWGGSNNEIAAGVIVDSAENIYVTGRSGSVDSNGDAFLLKFDSSGNLLIQKTYGGSAFDSGEAIALDSSGNIYVTGISNSIVGFGGQALFVVKFAPNGDILMQTGWTPTGVPNGIVVDPSGNIYVAGEISDGTSYNAFLVKLNSTGYPQWEKIWGGDGFDSARAVTADSTGMVYAVGTFYDKSKANSDFLILKYDSSGNLIFVKTWGGLQEESARGVDVGGDGNVYVMGWSNSLATARGAYFAKLDSSGNILLQRNWGGASFADTLNGALDASGNVLIAGYVTGPPPFSATTPSFSTATPAGGAPGSLSPVKVNIEFPSSLTSLAVQAAAGSTSYGGGEDAFIVKFSDTPPATTLTYSAFLLIGLAVTVPFLLYRRTRR